MRNTRYNGLRREVAALAVVLVGGLVLAFAQGHGRRSSRNSPASLSSMVHLAGRTITVGIDASDIARFQRLFSVSVAQLFEEAVPKHKVKVRSFFIDKYLVTNSQFKKFVDGSPEWQRGKVPVQLDNGNYLRHWKAGTFAADQANDPVVNVNWYAATAYCQAQGKRLPAEAEWEYAARGGLWSPLFPWGNKPPTPRLANYSAGKRHTTTPVGSYPPNGYGLYDMAGNVWEFLADEWRKYPSHPEPEAANAKPQILATSFREVRTRRVIRGGSFDGDPINLWVEYRDSHPPNGSQPFVGFRCAK